MFYHFHVRLLANFYKTKAIKFGFCSKNIIAEIFLTSAEWVK